MLIVSKDHTKMGVIESGLDEVIGTRGFMLQVGSICLCTYKTESALRKECEQIVKAYEKGRKVYTIKGELD